MKELLDKLSSYNVFNYLLPGIIFSVIVTRFTEMRLLQFNIVIGVFVYYFIGLIISRIGSLLIEPLLKKTRFIKFSKYSDYVEASDKDKLIGILSESNNMYRTFIAMFLLIIFVKVYYLLSKSWSYLVDWGDWILVFSLLIMFVFSYWKQTKYIKSRVESQINE